MFKSLYHKMKEWAGHRHAPYLLAGVSFSEASFFPLPPDFMLAPMVLAQPHNGWRWAWITTIFSVLGGLLGYIIGFYAFEVVGQLIVHKLGLTETYAYIVTLFDTWGIWLILLAGVTPVPYKMFTIAAGVSGMPLIPFILGSMIGRMSRFFLVTGLIKKYGPAFEEKMLSSIDRWGWVVVAIIASGLCYLQITK